jgi:hypothetical protein
VARIDFGGAPPPANNSPTIAQAASVAAISGSTGSVRLQVLGADVEGESQLSYTWAAVGTPPGLADFNVNGTNGAKISTVTVTAAGSYTFQATAVDAGGLTAASAVSVTFSSGNPGQTDGVPPAKPLSLRRKL